MKKIPNSVHFNVLAQIFEDIQGDLVYQDTLFEVQAAMADLLCAMAGQGDTEVSQKRHKALAQAFPHYFKIAKVVA